MSFFPIKSYKLIGLETEFQLNPLSDLKHFFKEKQHKLTINLFFPSNVHKDETQLKLQNIQVKWTIPKNIIK